MYFVGFDTSNYTTSVSVVSARVPSGQDGDGSTPSFSVVANCKRLLPVLPGQRGLRQSDAVFHHARQLPGVIAEAKSALAATGGVITAVGCSSKPRDLEDSYMPCFLPGVAAAHALALSDPRVPVYEFSHQSGHIRAALYSSGAPLSMCPSAGDGGEPFLAFHVSGGTTDVLFVRPNGTAFDLTPVGESADLHAGQLVDRVGVMMGLPFPCGPQLEQLALTNRKPLPGVKICVRSCVAHLSGGQNMAERLWKDTSDAALTAAFTLTFLGRTLAEMTRQAMVGLSRDTAVPVLYSGGVMSNKWIRPLLTARAAYPAYFSEPSFSADNAAGIALLTAERYIRSLTREGNP